MIYIDDNVYDGIIMKPDLDDALEHYGKKGMKWRKHLKGALSAASNGVKRIGWKVKNKKYDVVTGLSKKSKVFRYGRALGGLANDVYKGVKRTKDEKDRESNKKRAEASKRKDDILDKARRINERERQRSRRK